MIYVLDTHALVWFLQNNPKLGDRASALFDDPTTRFAVPTLVLCEIAHLAQKGRLEKDLAKIIQHLRGDDRFEIISLDEAVVGCLPKGLDILDIHDAVIVATTLALGESHKEKTCLITRDGMIRDSKLVDVVWD